jgi:hypothetical protein
MQKIRSHRAVSVGPTCNTRAVTWVVTMRAQIRIQTRTQIRNQIRTQTRNQIRSQIGIQKSPTVQPLDTRGVGRGGSQPLGLWSAALGAVRAGGARRRGADLGARRWVSLARELGRADIRIRDRSSVRVQSIRKTRIGRARGVVPSSPF